MAELSPTENELKSLNEHAAALSASIAKRKTIAPTLPPETRLGHDLVTGHEQLRLEEIQARIKTLSEKK